MSALLVVACAVVMAPTSLTPTEYARAEVPKLFPMIYDERFLAYIEIEDVDA